MYIPPSQLGQVFLTASMNVTATVVLYMYLARNLGSEESTGIEKEKIDY
jgi:hypothetical protein